MKRLKYYGKLNFNLAEYMTPPTEVKEMRCV